MKRTLAAALSVAGLFMIYAGESGASTYVQAYAGAALQQDSDARGAGVSGEVDVDHGFVAGLKVGGWWEAKPSLGLQFDFNGNFIPLAALTSGGVRADLSSDLNVYAVTLNALARLPGGFIKPYAGIGGGYYYATVEQGTISTPLFGISTAFPEDSDEAFGWNALGGVEFELLPDKLSAFAEYKYSQADFEFKKIGIEMDYSSSQVYGGFTYTF